MAQKQDLSCLRRHTRKKSVILSMRSKSAYGYKDVRYTSLVFLPCLSILYSTSFNISKRSVNDHASEENRIEPWEGTLETRNQAPAESEKKLPQPLAIVSGRFPRCSHISCIMYLPRIFVCDTLATSSEICGTDVHQPSTRSASPVSVSIVSGFSICRHGS